MTKNTKTMAGIEPVTAGAIELAVHVTDEVILGKSKRFDVLGIWFRLARWLKRTNLRTDEQDGLKCIYANIPSCLRFVALMQG